MLLSVKNLSTEFPVKKGIVRAVEDVSFDVDQGEILAIVGESGSGKSVTSLSIMGLLAEPGHVAGGSLEFEGKDLATLSEKQYRELRGNDMAMIFQEPMTSLNPVYRVGNQIVEAEVPMAEMGRYAIDLRSMTQGRGSFTFRFVRYEDAPPAVQEKAIEAAKAMQDEAD